MRLHTHLAEDPDEDEFCLRTFGCRPVEYLERVGWAKNRTWVAHCVHPNAREIRMLGTWGVGVAHCPSSNQILGTGLAPVRARPCCWPGCAAGRAPLMPGMPWSLPPLEVRPAWDATISVRWLRARPPTWRCGPCRVSRLRARCRIPLRPGCAVAPWRPATLWWRARRWCETVASQCPESRNTWHGIIGSRPNGWLQLLFEVGHWPFRRRRCGNPTG